MLSASKMNQLGGAAFIFGNLLFLANKFDEMSRLWLGRYIPDVISGQNPFLILLGQAALIVGYVALYRFYEPKSGRFGTYALRVVCSGGILLAIGHVGFISSLPWGENLFVFVLLGTTLLLIGLIWFGIINLRQPILGRWAWLPLFTGIMGAIGFFGTSGQETRAIFLVFRTLFALGLVGLGIALWLEKPTAQSKGYA